MRRHSTRASSIADGTKVLAQNFQCQEPNAFLDAIEPFRADLIGRLRIDLQLVLAGDSSGEQKIPFILGHALYLKAIHGGKVKSDKIDSEKIAYLLRGGNFPLAHSYPKELVRLVTCYADERFGPTTGETLAHIQIVHHQHNLPKPTNIKYKANRKGIADQLPSDPARLLVDVDFRLLDAYDTQISRWNWNSPICKVHASADLLSTDKRPGNWANYCNDDAARNRKDQTLSRRRRLSFVLPIGPRQPHLGR